MSDLPRIEEGQTFCWHRVLTSALRQFQPISKLRHAAAVIVTQYPRPPSWRLRPLGDRRRLQQPTHP